MQSTFQPKLEQDLTPLIQVSEDVMLRIMKLKHNGDDYRTFEREHDSVLLSTVEPNKNNIK